MSAQHLAAKITTALPQSQDLEKTQKHS